MLVVAAALAKVLPCQRSVDATRRTRCHNDSNQLSNKLQLVVKENESFVQLQMGTIFQIKMNLI